MMVGFLMLVNYWNLSFLSISHHLRIPICFYCFGQLFQSLKDYPIPMVFRARWNLINISSVGLVRFTPHIILVSLFIKVSRGFVIARSAATWQSRDINTEIATSL